MGKLGYQSRAVFKFIMAYWAENKTSPSIRDINREFDIVNSVTYYHLGQLERYEKILPRVKNQARNIIPVEISELLEDYFNSPNRPEKA